MFFIKLYQNRNKLDKKITRQQWGYLYNEYKSTTYYWEITKIFEKFFIIICLIYYSDDVGIKVKLK
jgi:hypothetical protein